MFARLHGSCVNDVYRIDLARAKNPLVLKIYGDEPAWIVAKEALVASWIGERAGIPIPHWLRVDERRTCIQFRFALTTWLVPKRLVPRSPTENNVTPESQIE